MNRRDFIRSIIAAPIGASLAPLIVANAKPIAVAQGASLDHWRLAMHLRSVFNECSGNLEAMGSLTGERK